MHNTREKLIALVRDAKFDVDRICVERDWCEGCPAASGEGDCKEAYIADHLIANGVTVQELDGCEFCQKFDFAGARAEVNKYGAHINLAICNTKFPDEERFKFCPMCGSRLPQPPKGE